MYLVRYEEISLGDAVELLEERNGWFDGDSRCVVCLNETEMLLNMEAI